MRINEEIKLAGIFWLPESPGKTVPGTLRISDGGEIQLETLGLFHEQLSWDGNQRQIGRVVGRTEASGYITLDDCFYTHRKHASIGLDKAVVYVNKAIVGARYGKDEETLFNAFQFSVEGIDEWVGISGIRVETDFASGSSNITYSAPDDITIELCSGLRLQIVFAWTAPALPSTTEAKVTQKARFRLVSDEKRPLVDFFRMSRRLTTLLGFALDQPVCIEDVTITDNEFVQSIGSKQWPVPLKLYYPSLPFTTQRRKVRWDRMLFSFPQIQNDASRLINRWLEAYELIAPALELYFSTTRGSHESLDGKFLALAQGLEAYHRRTSTETVMEEEEFQGIVEALLERCPQQRRKWLQGKLKYANEVNPRQRVKAVIQPFEHTFGNRRERRRMIDSIVVTRNYFTHFDPSLKNKAASGRDLLILCDQMQVIFQLHLLQVVGFSEEEVRRFLDSSYWMRQKLHA